MRRALALLLGILTLPGAAKAGDIMVSPPRDLSVTVYRAPYRGEGGFNLDALGGFALISETRTVTIPAGENRLRFEGVADGIDPASAIITGLPSGVIEKNRDAQLLSPSALLALTLGRPVTLVRHLSKQAEPVRVEGRLLSDTEGGVVFESKDGIEALRCSGLSETFSFDGATPGLSAQPTLSVLTRSDHPLTATVTLSYLASGFDWAADYVATLSPDGRTLDLGAWVTLANGNGSGFPQARTQVVAGRVNHGTGEVEPIDRGEPILARCWPQGTTSSISLPVEITAFTAAAAAAPPVVVSEVMVTAQKREQRLYAVPVAEEQLGDLKLYRTPDRTTVASRQSKQVRLLDRQGTPVERIYGADLVPNTSLAQGPAVALLRTRNDAAHNLGLPLPQGRIIVFQSGGASGIDGPLLIAQTGTRDLAVNEEVEWLLGNAPDIQVSQTHEKDNVDHLDDASRVEITNAGTETRTFELRLRLEPGASLVKADHPAGAKDGRPIFRLKLAPYSTTVVRYQTHLPPHG